jgi:hypothetical protein
MDPRLIIAKSIIIAKPPRRELRGICSEGETWRRNNKNGTLLSRENDHNYLEAVATTAIALAVSVIIISVTIVFVALTLLVALRNI